MCGINGILRLHPEAPPITTEELLTCRDAMARRGPDDAGTWISLGKEVGFGHRRLAILDLSPLGAQPMSTPDGRLTAVLNGEIYNFRALRDELGRQGFAFRSQSDTEVILALYARDGAAMLPRLRGMFALALWDAHAKTLLLARDPYGIKPLYYTAQGGRLHFASQVKALEAAGVAPEVDPTGLAGFLLWGAVPEPWTFRRGVKALPAGTCLVARYGADTGVRPYGAAHEGGVGADPRVRPLDAAITDSVAAHLVSDVPVAVFLSGGLDSSLVAALARRASAEIATFTLSFDALQGTALDEAPLAEATARRLGTRHLTRAVTRADVLELEPALFAAMDQPSIDGLNTFLVAKLVAEAGFKVVLSGLGGDEVFGSYPSFTDLGRGLALARRGRRALGLHLLWPWVARLAFPGRPKVAGLFRHGSTLAGAYLLRRGLFLPEELSRLLGRAAAREALAAYDPRAHATAELAAVEGAGDDPWLAAHTLESNLYLRHQLLRDADWASMAHSVELRVPLVDARLRAELLGSGFAGIRGRSKAEIVRELAPELPEELFHQPKRGFYVPLAEWAGSTGESRAQGSRALARRVLTHFGIVLPS